MIKKAFTLAEIMIVITLLGIVAAVSIPNALHQNSVKAGKVKIRKSIAAYEKVVDGMIIENNLVRTTSALSTYANMDGQCTNAKKYFHTITVDEHNPCIFKSKDGLWWDVSDITNTIVSFKQKNANQNDARGEEFIAFILAVRFEKDGAVRIYDNSYKNENNLDKYEVFTYRNAVNKIKDYLGESKDIIDSLMQNSKPCFDNVLTAGRVCTGANKRCRGCSTNWDRGAGTNDYYGRYLTHVYDENGNEIAYLWGCDAEFKECKYNSTNGVYIEREDGLFVDCYACNKDFSASSYEIHLQKKDAQGNIECSCHKCEGGAYNNNCKGSRTCTECSGTNCPVPSSDGCYHL